MAPQAHPPKKFSFTGRVPLNSPEEADTVVKALNVDPELRPNEVERELHVEGSEVVISFRAVDPVMLRAALGPFFDLLGLAVKAIDMFGDNGSAFKASDKS